MVCRAGAHRDTVPHLPVKVLCRTPVHSIVVYAKKAARFSSPLSSQSFGAGHNT